MPSKLWSGIGADADLGLAAGPDQRDVLLVHVRHDPHRGQIGDLVETVAGHEAHALDGLLFHDDAGHRRAERERAPRLSGLGQRPHLFVGDVPVLESGQARIGEALHAGLRIVAGVLQRLDRLGGDRIFALRRHQFRAVDLEQRLALADRLAGGVDEELLHPAFELRRDGEDAPLVDLDAADGLDDLVQRTHRRRLAPHAELLHLVDADLDLAASGVGLLAVVDGDVVHPHRILLRHRRRVGQSHRIAVVQDLPLGLGRPSSAGSPRPPPPEPGPADWVRVPHQYPAADAHRHGNGRRQESRSRTHRSSPNSRSIAARRAWASACAFSRSCLDLRICRCASSSVAKSTFPVS